MAINEVNVAFLSVAEAAQTLAFMARDRDLQVAEIDSLTTALQEIAVTKAAFVEQKDENSANWTLTLELALCAMRSELRMYVDLRGGLPESAWNHLVDAQDAATAALHAHPNASTLNLENYCTKLDAIEVLLFPPQAFMSTGYIVRRAECSICGQQYDGGCPHVKGRAYMGQFCAIICKDVEVLEISLVDRPADKRCRVTHFSDGGRKRNKMTWALEEEMTGSTPTVSNKPAVLARPDSPAPEAKR